VPPAVAGPGRRLRRGRPDILPELGDLADVFAEVGFHASWSWSAPFARFRELVDRGGAATRFGQAFLQAIHRGLANVPDGGSALFVSHGTALEIALVSALPDGDHGSWGLPFSHLEGARLFLEEGQFRLDTLIRSSRDPTARRD
jgi:hypothetical protein